MPERRTPTIEVNPRLSPEQLFTFYERNQICEVGFGKDVAARVLEHPHLIVAALEGEDLVGLARATFDGLSAHVMELSIDLRWQAQNRHGNGSLVETDPKGLGMALGQRLLSELEHLGCTFISGHVVEGVEEDFYRSLGFAQNDGHTVVCIDQRPYVKRSSP